MDPASRLARRAPLRRQNRFPCDLTKGQPMPLTYTINEDARPVVMNLIGLFYPDLRDAGVTFDILECAGGLKFHGYTAAAVIKVNSLKDRVAGLNDCRILLNAEVWKDADKKRRQALIDHELHHLEVVRD